MNDMGALNLDAEEIKKHKLIQEKQEMVEVRLLCVVYLYVCTYKYECKNHSKDIFENRSTGMVLQDFKSI